MALIIRTAYGIQMVGTAIRKNLRAVDSFLVEETLGYSIGPVVRDKDGISVA